MYKFNLDIVNIDSATEVVALRATVETMSNTKTNTYHIGLPKHVAELFSGKEKRSEIIFLSCHGDEKGICLFEIGEDLKKDQPFLTNISPSDIKKYFKFDGNLIINSGCLTGTREMADAFLDSGAKYYIAPNGYPYGTATMHFLNTFFYFLLGEELTIEESFEKARNQSKRTELFTLYKKES